MRGGHYIITGPKGVVKEIPLDEARKDSKLKTAIKRNSWEPVDGE